MYLANNAAISQKRVKYLQKPVFGVMYNFILFIILKWNTNAYGLSLL